MSVNVAGAALAALDLIERLCGYRTHVQALGRTAAIAELDTAIEQARHDLACLRATDDGADPTRFAELIDELRERRPQRATDC